jgi:TIR domain
MANSINTFIIYAREDIEIKRRIVAHLNPFVKFYNLVIWHDEYIEPGQAWKPQIESRLEQTDLFLLLVSVDFMNSEFINQVEFKFAIDRHKQNKSILIPIIINYCQWDIEYNFGDFNFNLNELQVLPEQAKPVDDWKTAEQAYNNIAAGIRKVLEAVKTSRAKEASTEKQKSTLSDQEQKNDIFIAKSGTEFEKENEPEHFIARSVTTTMSKPSKLLSFTTGCTVENSMKIILLFAKENDYKVEEFDENKGIIILSDSMTLFSNGFFYPIYLVTENEKSTLIEIGIKSKLIQFGPIVRRSHEKCFDGIKAAIFAN